MGILTSLVGEVDKSPSSDYWYTPIGQMSKAGVQVNEDQLLRISAVLQGIRFPSQTLAALPKFVYRHLEDGRSREKERGHYLNRLIRYQPNPWQTAFQFIEMMTAQMLLKGFGFAQKIFDDAGNIEALIPLKPERLVKVEQRPNYMLRFLYRREDGKPRNILQEEVFFLPGFGVRDFLGLPLEQLMTDTAGLELAIESYGSNFFSNSAMPRVVLSSPKVVSDKARDRMAADWNRAFSSEKQHSTAFLEEDTKVQHLSTKNDEAQFIESRKFLIAEFSRYLDVTPHRLSDMEKSSYNNMEQMSLETVIYTLTPLVARWEQCCYRDLLSEEDKEAGRFIEFSLDGLLRGDTSARSQFYKDGIYAGWLKRNEVREKENHNPVEGLDDPLQPQNYVPIDPETGEPRMPAQTPQSPPPQETQSPPSQEETRAQMITVAAAERVTRKEVQAISRWKERKAGSAPDWRKQIEAFYAEHAALVAKAMAINEEIAKKYCDVQCAIALKFGPDAIDKTKAWCEEHAVAFLVTEALK
jgi:HK97 family phage portal protein